MSRWYRFWYGVGVTPWESDTPTLAGQIDGLVADVEARRGGPDGRALDLGCGTGRWSIALARRGWQVTGVDVVPKAIRAARRRADEAGVDADFLCGDVTALRDAGLATGFSLLLDVECFNHLDDDQRGAVGREIDALATDDAELLLLAWTRARRGPLPPGVDHPDLRRTFPRWRIAEERPYDGELPAPLRRAAPTWYRLVRSDGGA